MGIYNDFPLEKNYNMSSSDYHNVSISYLALSSRTELLLKRNNILTIEELLKSNTNYLLSLDGMGTNSINEVTASISNFGSKTIRSLIRVFPERHEKCPVSELNLNGSITTWLWQNEIYVVYNLLNLSIGELLSFPENKKNYLNAILKGLADFQEPTVNFHKTAVDLHEPIKEEKTQNAAKATSSHIMETDLSNRVKHGLLKNGIDTIDKLKSTNDETLTHISGFGIGCITEIKKYLRSLSQDDITVMYPTLNSESDIPDTEPSKITIPDAFMHKEQIINGDFSFLDNYYGITRYYLEKYREAYNTLDNELVTACVYHRNDISEIIKVLSCFRTGVDRSIRLSELMDDVPYARRNCKIDGFINTFAQTDHEEKMLHHVINNENCMLKDIIVYKASVAPENFELVQRFLSWCSYDLKADVKAALSQALSNEQRRQVISSRAKGATLQEVGSILNVTRERIRQIENRARKQFSSVQARARIISKISADNNGITVITPEIVAAYSPEYGEELVYLLKTLKSNYYTYDKAHDVFIYGDSSLSDRVRDYVDSMPSTFSSNQLRTFISTAVEEEDFPEELVEKIIADSYRITGEVYHKSRLSQADIYRSVLEKHFPTGFKACEPSQMALFRNLIIQEYGADVHIPDNDRAIVARLQDIATICDRGTYIARSNQAHLPNQLAKDIHDYIKTGESKVFLTNTLFAVFEDRLLKIGINNKYYLQSILREKYEDEFVFRRDYISRDASFTSIHTEIVNFIREFNYPVSKKAIYDRFPGLTEIVLVAAIDDNNIINLFGQYLHKSKLKISVEEKEHFRAIVTDIVSDGKPHHGEELFSRVNREIPEVLARNFALYPFCAFSIAENLFRNEFQFSRPLFAKEGIEDIGYPVERLRDFILKHKQISFEEMSKYSKEIHYQIYSFLELSESLNDQFFMLNEKGLISIEQIGIDEDIARQVEDIIAESLVSTKPIRELPCLYSLPQIAVSWTEWLVFSTLKKWSTKLSVATSSPRLNMAVPLVSPLGKMNIEQYANLQATKSTDFFSNSNELSTDDILMELIDDDSLWEDLT